jgi:hypothetical protein
LKKTNKPHKVHKDMRGRESGKPERYVSVSPRVEVSVCNHSQFLDTDTSISKGVCLDCGAHIKYQTWGILSEMKILTDSELEAKREQFNEIWFGEFSLPSEKLPNIEELTAEVARLSDILEQMKKEN